MPIRREHGFDIPLGPVVKSIGRDQRMRELERQQQLLDLEYAQLDETARRYDLGLAAQMQQSTLDRQFGYDQMGQRADEFQQGLAADVYTRQLDADAGLAQQMLQNAGYEFQQQQITQRAVMNSDAQNARARARRQFDKAMADREAILGMQKEGSLTPRMLEEAIRQWEEQNQMDWGLPDQIAQQQTEQDVTARVLPAMRQRLGPLGNTVTDQELGTFILPDGTVNQEGFDAFVKDKQEWEKIRISEERVDAAGTAESEPALIEKKTRERRVQQQVEAPDIKYDYEAEVQKAKASAFKRFQQLLKEAAAAASTKGDVAKGIAPKTVTPDELPASVRKRLSEQALMENPMPLPPPGYMP